MRIPKNISLDRETAKIAGEIPEFSAWVRAVLLAWDEQGRPPIGDVLEEKGRVRWQQAVTNFRQRVWGRANVLKCIKHDESGTWITAFPWLPSDASLHPEGSLLAKLDYALEALEDD